MNLLRYDMLPHILILVTIIGNVAALVMVKMAVTAAGQAPKNVNDLIPFFIRMITSLYTWLAVFAVFIGLLAFWLVLTKMELSRVYPIIGGLSYVIVALLGVMIFKDNMTLIGWLGVVLVVAGVFMLFHN